MVRTLTPRTEKGQRTVLLPGSTAAEPWELWSFGTTARCLKVGANPRGLAPTRETTLALPVTEVVALPLWLQETRASELTGMVALQIESHGLQSRGRPPVFDWTVVAREETRTLVLAGVLASLLPEEMEPDELTRFDVSARCRELPADALIFWRERDGLVMAATRANQLAYFHALPEPQLTPRVLQDITCILAALRMQEVIGKPLQAVIWSEEPVAGADDLEAILGVRVRHESRPLPRLPDEPWKLTPTRVDAVTRERTSRRWRWRAVLLVALLAVIFLAAVGTRFVLISRHVDELRNWQAAHASDLAMVHDTADAWRELRPAIDPHTYPLELLLHVSEALPDEQIRLTLFQMEGDHLLIRAEAKNLTAAFDFFDRLKKNPALDGYTWEMAQPHLLGNDITQMEVEGTHASRD